MLPLLLHLHAYMVNAYSPDLVLTKGTTVQGDDGTVYRVNITVKHALTSTNDSFNVTIEDHIHRMDVISVRVEPRALNADTRYSMSSSPRIIWGLVPRLPMKETVSLIYFAKFQRSKEEVRSESRVMLTWEGMSGNKIFGPKYGNASCVVKQLRDKKSSLGNYGFLVLAILLGILFGCLVAYMLVQCLKRYPSTKKYILHSDEETDAEPSIPSAEPAIMPVYYDKPAVVEDTARKTKRDYNIFKKWTNSRHSNATGTSTMSGLSDEMLWRTNLFNEGGANRTSLVNEAFNEDYISLLEYSLDAWMHLWKSVVGLHIGKLVSGGRVKGDNKSDQTEKFNKAFLIHKGDIKDINGFMDHASGVILANYRVGLNLFKDTLEGISITEDGELRRTTGKVVPGMKGKENQLRKRQEDLQQEKRVLVGALELDFSQLSGKLFETFHHISTVCINVHLATISTAFLLVVLKKSISMLHYWMKHTESRQTDILKRKRLVNDEMDSNFQQRFIEELELLVSHLHSKKTSSMKSLETSVLSQYLAQKQAIREHFSSTLSDLGATNIISLLQDGVTSTNLLERFEVVKEYTDSYAKLVFDENLFLDFHSTFLSDMTHALKIFFSRMKSHTDDIYNNKLSVPEQVNDLGSFVGDPIELLKVSEVNHLGTLISSLDLKCSDFVSKLKEFMETTLSSIQNHGNSLREFSNGILTGKSSKKFNQISLRQLLFKCYVHCHTPISWDRCARIVELSPKSCISGFFGQVLSSQCLLEVQCGRQVDKVIKAPATQLTAPLLDKLDLISTGISQEIDTFYQSTKTYIRKFELKLSSVTRNLQKGTYLEHFQYFKRIKLCELLLDITCSFLADIFQSKVEKDEDTVHNLLINYRKMVLKTMRTARAAITTESEREVKSKLVDVLQKYTSACKIFITGEHSMRTMQDIFFNQKELSSNMFELGKQFKCLEDRLSSATTLVLANIKLLRDLLPLNLISKEKSDMYLHSILCLCQQDLDDSFKLTWGNEGSEMTMEYLMRSLLNIRSVEESGDAKC